MFSRVREHLSRFGWMRGYCSLLGLKIAVAVAVLIVTPLVLFILLHEYNHEGGGEFETIASSPFFWAGVLFIFGAFMVALSKIVILPLKRFELHIGKLEQGLLKDPFLINRSDEIGYLADRFNSLHKMVTDKLEVRDQQLSVLYHFTNATSGIFEVPALMDSFFNILSTAVDFDTGSYLIFHKNHLEGRIYSEEGLGDAEASGITRRVVARACDHIPNLPRDKAARFGVTVIRKKNLQDKSAANGAPTHFVELPLLLGGEAIGMVTLISTSAGVEPVTGTKVFNAMVQHANTVIEKIYAHINDEQRKLANILSSMSEGVFFIDADGYTTSMNRKGVELIESFCKFGKECSGSGFDIGACACPGGEEGSCEFSAFLKKIKTTGAGLVDDMVHTEEIKNSNGLVYLLSVSRLKNGAGREGFVITAKDITEDRLIQKRVLLSSKLAALGEMAAGIAHEVNNPLQVMMANIELLDGNVSEKGVRRLENLRDGILRIKSIVRDLLIFAREQTTEVEDTDVNSVIEKVSDILGHQLKVANTNLELDLEKRPLVVRCNRNLFQQVIINLLQNAKDAIEESRKGSMVHIKSVLLPGGVVVVEVSDDGPGIPEHIIDRIFDPFFTTKDVGKGTGLGLSVSRRIIEGMGGNITVKSSPKTGTTFTITLLHNRNVKRKEDKSLAEADYSRLKDKSVIVVDDEEGVVKAVKESIGPKVASMESSTDGAAAYEMIMDRDFDLILLDIKMPGLNGMELYRRIAETKPYLSQRIIFLTGDTENETTEAFIKLTGCRCLEKPFAMKELMNIMCEYEMEMR